MAERWCDRNGRVGIDLSGDDTGQRGVCDAQAEEGRDEE